jgi:hypothetical protein
VIFFLQTSKESCLGNDNLSGISYPDNSSILAIYHNQLNISCENCTRTARSSNELKNNELIFYFVIYSLVNALKATNVPSCIRKYQVLIKFASSTLADSAAMEIGTCNP